MFALGLILQLAALPGADWVHAHDYVFGLLQFCIINEHTTNRHYALMARERQLVHRPIESIKCVTWNETNRPRKYNLRNREGETSLFCDLDRL